MAKSIRETPEGQKAEQLQSNFRQALESIRADNRLTPEGKRQQIAGEYLRTSRGINAIRESVAANKEQRIGALRKDLFGITGGSDAQRAISYRDAQERVGSLALGDQDKAVKLLDQAELSGDEVMLKAIMQRSLEMQWVDVANTYIDKHPYYGAKLEELWDLQQPGGILGDAAGMDNGFLLYVPKPGELDSLYNDGQIEQVANGG